MKAANTMKTLLILKNSLKSRIPQAIVLLALIAAFAAFSGPDEDRGHGSYKLGGTWVGRMQGDYGDLTWTSTYNPDSSGRNATSTLEWITYGNFQFGALAPVGATKSSYASGNARMTGKDTYVTESIWYLSGPALEPDFPFGDDTPYYPEEIKAIAVMTGELHFVDHNTTEGVHHLKLYAIDNPETGGRDLSMVPTDAMFLYRDVSGIEAVNHKAF